MKRRGSSTPCSARTPRRRSRPPIRTCATRCAWRPSSFCFSTACPPTPPSTTPWRWSTRKSRRAGGFVNAVLRRVGSDGRAKLAEMADGEDARAWAASLSYPLWLVKLVRADAGRRRARRSWTPATPRRSAACASIGCAGACRAASQKTGRGGLQDARPRRPARRAALRRPAAGALQRLPRRARHAAVARLAARRHGGRRRRCRPRRRGPGPVRRTRRQDQPAGGPARRGPPSWRSRWTRSAPASCEANLARLGVGGRERRAGRRAGAARPGWDGAFDAVLLDAPCSGLGTLASRADLRWRRNRPTWRVSPTCRRGCSRAPPPP